MVVTHPGKLGDLLWGLPTVRKLSEREGAPVSLYLSAWCEPLAHLLHKQAYIADVVVDKAWHPPDTAPLSMYPPTSLTDQIPVVVLGYESWPSLPLPYEQAALAGRELDDHALRPWIQATPFAKSEFPASVLFHWTDRWFELKLGLTEYLAQRLTSVSVRVSCGPSGRWPGQWIHGQPVIPNDFATLARKILSVEVVVTDNSAVHVLCAALGKPVIVIEPETDRHHPIFWPGAGQDDNGHWFRRNTQLGKLIHPLLGGDHKPTFDCRHALDAIREYL